jgi:cytochrome b561
VRLLLRLALPVGSHDPTPPRWQRLASGGVHLALYAVMIVMPLLGWALLSAEGEAAGWFGFALPPLVGPNELLAEMLEELHETVGKAGYFLIGVHTAAALVHHYLFRDRLLVRMLPVRSRPA